MMFIIEQRTQKSRAAEIHDGVPSKWEPWLRRETKELAEEDVHFASLYRQDFCYRIAEVEG